MARGSVRKLEGAWGFRVDLRPDPVTGKRRQISKQGFATKRKVETALSELTQSIPDGTVSQRSSRTLGDFLDSLRPGADPVEGLSVESVAATATPVSSNQA